MKRLLYILILLMIWGCSSDTTTNISGVVPEETDVDSILPYIIATSPARGDSWVGVDCVIEAVFSENMNPSTISEATFYFADSTLATVDYHDRVATLTPVDTLNLDTDYLVYILMVVTDTAGNRMEDHYRLNFSTIIDTTYPPSDTTRPYVVETIPTDGDTEVDIDTAIRIKFSKRLAETSINTSIIHLEPEVSGSVGYIYPTLFFNPAQDLVYGTEYRVTISSDITDRDGNQMAADYSWSFTTEPFIHRISMPLAIGNFWEYSINSCGWCGIVDDYDTVLIVGDTIIDDETWFVDQKGRKFINRPAGLCTQGFLWDTPSRFYPLDSTSKALVKVPAGEYWCYGYVEFNWPYHEVFHFDSDIGLVKYIYQPEDIGNPTPSGQIWMLSKVELQE